MATAALQQQITRLEQMVQSQQATIESLQQDRDFFATDLGKQIDQQIENAQRMRGTIGSEYLNITRFISKQIAHGMTRLQEQMGTLVATSLPVTVIQDLEKKYLAKPAATLDLEALTNRILLLETALATKQEIAATAATQVPAANQEELETLKQHVHHLETQMIQEVQRAHKTIHKPGEYAAPLQKLQTQVDMLRQELTSIKSVDGQALAQSLLTNTVSSLRGEFKQQLATKAAQHDLAKFQSDISRIEKFSREVQTGFYEMRAKHERLMEEMSHRFSAESLAAVESRLKSSSEITLAAATREQQRAFYAQKTEVEETISSLLETGKRLEMDVKSKYGPDILAQHIRQVQAAVFSKNTEFQTFLEKQTTQGLTTMNLEIEALRRQQKEFTAKVSSELDSSTLRQKYAEFSAELEKQTEFFGTLKKSLETVKLEGQTNLAKLESQFSDYKVQMANASLEVAGISKSIEDAKRTIKGELASWMAAKEVALYKKFTDTSAEIQQVRDSYLLLQSDMMTQLQEHRQKEKDKYAEFQKTLWAKFEAWLVGRNEYLAQRILEISRQIQTLVEQANKREEDLQVLFSEKTLREFVLECERRLRLAQDSWMSRRTEELQLKYTELDRTSATFKHLSAESAAREARMALQYGEKAMMAYISKLDVKLAALQNALRGAPAGINKKERQYAGLTKCFYTAIFAKQGQTADTLAPVPNKIPGWRYICFTNVQMEPVQGWQIVRVRASSATSEPRLEAKKYKWLSHKYLGDFDVAIWVDAYMAPNPMFSELLKQWILEMTEQQKYIAHRPHEERDCVYEECDAVVEYKRETAHRAEAARNLLQAAKVPEHGGLFDTNIIVRFHKQPAIQEISEKIYEYLKTITYRDQLIAPLVYHKENFTLFQTYQLLRAFNKTGEHVRNLVQ